MSAIQPQSAVIGRSLRVLGAVCLVLGPVAFAVAEYASPEGAADPAGLLATMSGHATVATVSIAATLISAFGLIVGTSLLLARRLTRGRAFIATGTGLMVAALLLNTVALGVNVAFIAMADPSMDRGQMIALLQLIGGNPIAPVVLSGHDLLVLALLILGIGLWRAGVGPRWAAAAIGLCGVVDMLGGMLPWEAADIAGSAASNALLVAGFAAEAWFLVREPMRDAVAAPAEVATAAQ